MTFIGEDGFPAPLLKDAKIDESLARKLYLDSVRIIHRFYNEAKLVHADLSEFNMLYIIYYIVKYLFSSPTYFQLYENGFNISIFDLE